MKSTKKISAFLILILIFSCSSDNNDDNSNNNLTNLTLHRWVKEKVSINNITMTLPDCSKEDYYDFNSNGTYETHVFFDAGNNSDCIQFDAGEFGTYNYNESENKLELFVDDGVDLFEIILIDVEITPTTLKFSLDFDENGTYETREEYKKLVE